MNQKKDSELKKRLAEMKVSQPLRLSKPKLVESQIEAPLQIEVPHSEAAKPKQPLIELPQTDSSQIEEAHSEAPHSEVAEKEKADSKVPEIEKPSSGAPQIEVVPLGPPHIEDAQCGFFKLSHSVFRHSVLRKVSGDCFRLFLWLSSRAWRYPDSDGSLRASVGFIELNVGMGHATISRGLKTLKAVGLISLEEVNFKKGNLWHISPAALGTFDPENAPPRFKALQNEAPEKRVEATSKRGGSSLKSSGKVPQIEHHLININKTKNSEECADDPPQFEAALREFGTVLSEEVQHSIIEKFTAREFPHGILPPANVVKRLVAMDWFTSSKSVALSA